MEPDVELFCAWCESRFAKAAREHRRQVKGGRDYFYCSRSCQTRARNKANPPKGDARRLDAGNRRDYLTPFRWFLLRARQHSKGKGPTDLTLEYLRWLWVS